jgi:hypothetical protein
VYIYSFLGYGWKVSQVAIIIGSATALAFLWDILRSLFIGPRIKDSHAEGVNVLPPAEEGKGETVARGKAGLTMLWLGALFVLILLFGFAIAIPIFMLAFLLYHRLGLWKSVIFAGSSWVAAYLLFEVALKIMLFDGILFGDFLPPL